MFAALALACLVAPDDDYREPGPARPVPGMLWDTVGEAEFPYIFLCVDRPTQAELARTLGRAVDGEPAARVAADVTRLVKADRLMLVPYSARVEVLGQFEDDSGLAMLVRVQDGKYAGRLGWVAPRVVYRLDRTHAYPLSKAEQRRALERRSSWARKSLDLGRAAERSGSPSGAAVYYREALAYPDTPEAAEAARRIAAIEGQSHLPRGR